MKLQLNIRILTSTKQKWNSTEASRISNRRKQLQQFN